MRLKPGPAALRLPVLGVLAALSVTAPSLAAAPPSQPTEGPGGIGDKSATIAKRAVGRASGASYVFHKAGPAPEGGRPVAVFLHAWGAPNPQAYGAWIDHLARHGWLVLFPRFQEVNRTRPADAPAIAARLLKSALADLANDADARPDTSRLALIGHLAGAPLAAHLAAEAEKEGLPAPKLVYVTMPGGIARDAKSRGIPLGDLDGIAPKTLLVTVIGDRDARAADAAARRILRDAHSVPPERKLFVRALSDDHGFPALTATLAAPAGLDAAYDGGAIKLPPDPPGEKPPPFRWSADMALSGEQTTLVSQINNARADSLDYLAFWRTFDMAASAAFAGKDATSLKNDPAFSDMRRWGDGWPVKRLGVEIPKAPTAAPAAVQR
ncbi:alpha/beta hydrolase fold domain-containing protein [Methylobacterium sp. B4]|uniref:poly(ethylene terephthalate) hydrolase family protein n=1 Tax=Methylobacterium sp. B4 TaxID=1938755 RepID=UPI000D76F4F5|nr:alpha/beta hydrolase fold domain-containing protein [Methylobacterium sp. B4]PXW56950.1 acetyl esterase/lipase [Methylobacterium sp. B4]